MEASLAQHDIGGDLCDLFGAQLRPNRHDPGEGTDFVDGSMELTEVAAVALCVVAGKRVASPAGRSENSCSAIFRLLAFAAGGGKHEPGRKRGDTLQCGHRCDHSRVS